MPTISLVINCDTRPAKDSADGLFSGTSNEDFLTDGIANKIKFFEGFDIETIVFIDEHLPISDDTLQYLRSIADTVVVRKHTSEPGFNDNNYLSALSLATGKYVCHCDQDTALFTSSAEPINKMIGWLESWDYISYPSHWSPKAVDDPTFDHVWASTRFFICKRETIDFTELRWMMADYNRCYEKYPANRKCFWTEHWLGLIARDKGKGVFYPAIVDSDCLIFSWGRYEQWLLRRLNGYSYQQVLDWVISKSGIQYPNDVFA
tara:strand:+ start:1883 stop:2668 length:786 start_codon:yes stop_codon:yes gene_type:complete